jgi:autonomous glycyl radical cofactor GrcA
VADTLVERLEATAEDQVNRPYVQELLREAADRIGELEQEAGAAALEQVALMREALEAVRASWGTRAHQSGCRCCGIDLRYQKYTCEQTRELVEKALAASERLGE